MKLLRVRTKTRYIKRKKRENKRKAWENILKKLQAKQFLQNRFTLTSLTSTIYYKHHHCPIFLDNIPLSNWWNINRQTPNAIVCCCMDLSNNLSIQTRQHLKKHHKPSNWLITSWGTNIFIHKNDTILLKGTLLILNLERAIPAKW